MGATPRQGEAITLHDKSMVVTAGAGTGKTYVLVQKYIDLLKTQGVSVPQILTLTFTDKAAAEMKERIRTEILKQEGPQWERAAEDFMIAPVQTFHSFCAQVLREFPIEAGLEPGFAVLDEQQVSRIHSIAYENLIHTRQEGPVNDALVHVLSITDQYNLKTILSAMYGKRERYASFFTALGKDENLVLDVWKIEVEKFRDEEIALLRKDPSFSSRIHTLLDLASIYDRVNDKAAVFLHEIRPLLYVLEKPADSREFCQAALELARKKPGNVGSKKVWKPDDLDEFKQSRKDLSEILDRKYSLFRMTVNASDPVITGSIEFLKSLSLVFSRYAELVGSGKAILGGLDFSDLILHARKLFLEQSGLVTKHFMPRFRYILVDEFQDTDLSQFDIILAIIGMPSPKTDCLFIVGDPKQSIYLFRDADVTRFKEAQEIITAGCKGRVVDLDISFRSTKEVIGLSNLIFSRLLASAEKPWEFGYEPVKISQGRFDHHGSVELLLPPKGNDAASTKRNEADIVARRIYTIVNVQPLFVYEEQPDHTFIERPARYGDIAILLEARTNLSYYLSALGEYGIPFYVHGGTGFYHRQEVYDLCNILSFLEHRHDNVSLAGILRSPYFGLPDTELFRIAQERGITFWDKLGVYAEKTGPGTASHARNLLISWQQYAGHVGLVALLRRILAESGVYTVYAALPAGEQILANIEKLVAMARVREEDPKGYALADFTADLRMAMDEDEREGEAPLDTLAENAVNIMTVHAAKGLEFPIVFVPDMGNGFREKFPPIMIGDNPLMVGVKVPNPDDNYEMTESAVLLTLREQQRQKERAERKRLLYVALTRARDHLFMSGTMPEGVGLSYDLARSRIEWIFTALGVTGDAIATGGLVLPDGLRLAIVSDPESIAAETGRVEPSLVVVPVECAGKVGTWTPQEYSVGPEIVKPISVSDLEKASETEPVTIREKVVSKYLPDVEGTKKGTIIHEVLRGRDAATVLREYGEYSEEHVRQCEEILMAFLNSDLMKRVKRSYCEVPFVVMIDGRPVTGKIDRLCEMDDGSWVVIDYKSEAVLPEEYAVFTKKYENSIVIYVVAGQQIVGGNVVGALYFTETGKFSLTKNE
ncbi:MAG: UvrD-helicase domain-containing protein [Methanoregula sp.]|uniref:UvrD-helicase domain-containing protein n=1 Tax=Methanoregula sp. TaxID=2052170 RepID=UPI0025EAE0A4|nr:UvrD-helicase domain-containing protein [Methanoregula sp.]MCK9632594.1 UvrD-helicase domain-containing protein [Methanoregula sp.]